MHKVAILIPCLNEEQTIAKTIKRFKLVLPRAIVYVCDNGSCDNTVNEAEKAGAIVMREPRSGKGYAINKLFTIEADMYLMCDGDNTYDSNIANIMLQALDNADLVIANRNITRENQTALHRIGNKIFSKLIKWIFKTQHIDVLSGYRAISRKFIENFPCNSKGFDIEIEMTCFALCNKYRIATVDTDYTKREDGSHSKLNALMDGLTIAISLVRNTWRTRNLKTFAFVLVTLAGVKCALSI